MCGGIKRGDIFFVREGYSVGCEQRGGRPAVIVSNNTCNRHSPVVSVVYLTSQRKKPLPTHVIIQSSEHRSTALCEQISAVSIERIGNYLCTCSDDEMRRIDQAMACALGIKAENIKGDFMHSTMV